MKLREKIKRFWTLDVHGHEGFTLVELIIVIAILAILSSVAVVGYSSYVEKANKQADLTLAAEIEQALMLAMYSNALTKGDYVIVYADGSVATFGNEPAGTSNDKESTIYKAMAAAYGDGWENSLKLKWNDWATNASANIGAIENSTFSPDNIDVLLGDVAVLTKAVQGFMGSNPSSDLVAMMEEYATSIGITDTSVLADNTALANLVPMMVAQNISNAQKSEDFSAAYSSIYSSADDFLAMDPEGSATALSNATGMDTVSAYAAIYARTEGVVNHVAGTISDKTEKETFLAKWKSLNANISDKATANVAMVTMSDYIAENYWDEMLTYFGASMNADDTISQTGNGKIVTDGNAFLAYMDGVDNSIPGLAGEVSGLVDADYYTSDQVTNLVLNYVTAGTLLAGNGADNAMVFIYSNGTVTCYPLDYIA